MKHAHTLILALAALTAAALPALAASDPDPQAAPDHGLTQLPFPLTSVVGGDYRLQPLDLVVFEVYGEPDVTTQQRIAGTGEMRLPMLGNVAVKGLTVAEAEGALEDRYRSGGIYKNPHVTLFVSPHSERAVAVLGQVNRPDRIPLLTGTDTLSLSRALALAGGLTRIARSSAIQVTRMGPDGRDTRFTVNLDAYLGSRTGTGTGDFQLLPDDVVFVPERSL